MMKTFILMLFACFPYFGIGESESLSHIYALSHWLWYHPRLPYNHQRQPGIVSMDGIFILISRKWKTKWLLWRQLNI